MAKEYPRTLRLESQLQRELSDLLRRELSDPRVAGVTVTHTKVAPDLHNATVFVSELGDDARLAAALAGLARAEPRLRRLLGHRLRVRLIPTLRFVPDNALREGDRMLTIIRDAVRRDEQVHVEEAGVTDASTGAVEADGVDRPAD
ncbi:MAG TPA: 30S ribosome-binding factor RbfA [Nevskiaceae bacterium]|nr:30S ribosome-binding factor RbfA [Nevskiaceae bacterium]